MKKFTFILIGCILLLSSSCMVNKKAQVEALAKCQYQVASISNLRVAGQPIAAFDQGDGVSLSSLPGIAFALLTKNLPLEAQVNLQIHNPAMKKASINQFKYIIEIEGKPLFEGTVDQNISLENGQSTIVPLTFNANIFGVAKERGLDGLFNDIFTRKGEGFITLKIKPSVNIAGKNFFYPGYITVDKNFGKSIKGLLDR